MDEPTSLLAWLPRGLDTLTRMHNTWETSLHRTDQVGARGPLVTLHDAEFGVTLTLHALSNDDLVFLQATVLELPMPNDVELATLALHCNDAPPILEFTIGPDIFEALDSGMGEPDTSIALFLNDLLHQVKNERNARFLQAIVPGATLEHAGGAVPFQAYGEWHDCPFYFRYRSAQASLSIALPGDDSLDCTAWHASIKYGDGLDGSLDFEEFVYLFAYLGAHLQRAPFRYEFRVISAPENSPEQLLPWKQIPLYGSTPEEAYAALQDSSFYDWEVDPSPLNSDPRRFPARMPDFTPSAGALERATLLPRFRQPQPSA